MKNRGFCGKTRFSDFAENFVIYSSDQINFEILGVLRNNFLMGLKINFKFEILGILVQNPHIQQAFPKRFSDFAENFFIISSEKIKFLNFGKSVKQLSYGFKIRLQFSKSGVFC